MWTALEHLSRAGVDASIATHAGAARIAAVLNTIAVAIMAKAPRPGAVKTRLCPPLRAAEAGELYQCFLLGYLAVVTWKREIRWCNVLLAACVAGSWGVGAADAQTARFPPADRPVAPIVTPAYSTEAERDAHGEAERVLNRLGVKPGMRVADVGAGDGYYTVRFAKRLGSGGTIYAEDVTHAYLDRLAARLTREGIAGVTIVHGTPADPRLPERSIDLALLAHMYHEVEQPYEFLYRLHAALAPGGRVAIIDNDKPTEKHGTPPALLRCELAAVGYRQVDFLELVPADGYLAVFAPPEALPRPEDIRPCRR